MPPIECHDEVGPQSIGEDGYRRIRPAEREFAVALHESGDRRPVLDRGSFHLQAGQAAQKARLGLGAKTPTNEVRHLGDDQGGHDEIEIRTAKNLVAGDLVSSASSSAIAPRRHRVVSRTLLRHPGQHPEQVGQAVEIGQQPRARHEALTLESHHASLRAAQDRAG